MEKFTEAILQKLGKTGNEIVKKKIRGLNGITLRELINSLISHSTMNEAAVSLGYSINPVKQAVREHLHPVFDNRSCSFASTDNRHLMPWRQELLNYIGYKYCCKCNNIYTMGEFWNNSTRTNNIDAYCKYCGLQRTHSRKQYIIQRTPKWSNMEEINVFYKNCPIGYQVDHIVPLKGKNVSGLHVIENLQYLTIQENMTKNNSYQND